MLKLLHKNTNQNIVTATMASLTIPVVKEIEGVYGLEGGVPSSCVSLNHPRVFC